MFRHIVLLRWAPDTSDDQVAVITTSLRGLPAAVPEIVSYRCGSDLGLGEGNADFGVVADFADREGWIVYRDHPAHQAIITEHISPHLAERTAIQYEIETG